MENITVIIPVHELIEDLLDKSLKSIDTQKDIKSKINVMIVFPKEIDLAMGLFLKKKKYKNLQIEKLVNNGKSDFQSQVNYCVENVTTEYFSILEFDDEFSNIYFRNVEKYIKTYPEIDSFLPMMVEVDKTGDVIKLTNEFVWSKSFIDDDNFGYLTNSLLQDFSYFFISGSVMKKTSFLDSGGLKTNFDVSAVYEFLLRFTYNNYKVFVIPKIGYLHLNDREGSATKYFINKYKEMDSKEEFERARKEHIFKK
jgi:hypothetical protein